MSQFYYKVTSKTKNPLDGFVTKKIKAIRRPVPKGYFATEEQAHHDWLVNVWRPHFNPTPVNKDKQLYRISFDGGGYFFAGHYTDNAESLITNLRNLGYIVELDKERADEQLYHIEGEDPVKPMTLEDAFELRKVFGGDVTLEEFNGQKTINIGRL